MGQCFQTKQHQKFLDIGLDNELFGHDNKSIDNKSKKRFVGLYQTKKILHRKKKSTNRRLPTEWEKIPANHVFDKGLLPKIH